MRITSIGKSKRGELLGDVEAVGVWQLHVDDDEIRFMFAGKLNAARARCRLSDDRRSAPSRGLGPKRAGKRCCRR